MLPRYKLPKQILPNVPGTMVLRATSLTSITWSRFSGYDLSRFL